MTTIIILLVVLLLAFLVIPFTRQIMLDKCELARNPINKKFEILASMINDAMMRGRGKITLFDDNPRLMNMMSDDMQNMLVQFYYSTGNLTIYLKYKYFHKEMVYEKQFNGLRNITVFQQKDIANEFVEVARKKILEHQQKTISHDASTMNGINVIEPTDSDPTSVISNMYRDLTESQKKSLVNLMYMIAQKGGVDEFRIRNSTVFLQQVLTLNIPLNNCLEQYKQYGEQRIYEDLGKVEDSIMDMIVLESFSMIMELDQDDNGQLENSFFSTFEHLGYTEEKIKNVIQKMLALQKLFGQ